MSKAKEMFEELGYEFSYNTFLGQEDKTIIKYGKRFDECIDSYGEIMFDTNLEQVRYNNCWWLDKNDIHAIHQQMIELGWIDG